MKWVLRFLVLLVALCALAWFAIPFPTDALDRFPGGTVLTDRAGQVLRVTLGPGDLDCRPVYEPDPTDWIVKAVVAAEDKRFWKHPGVDPLALFRAVFQNISAGRRISGASTLSTQVIRLMHPRKRTLPTKFIEAFRALQLERKLSKTEVLRQYLNRAPFGGNIYGIEAAAQRYYGKSAHDLSLAEAALLAGLPQSPTRFRPDRHLEKAQHRQVAVLKQMVAAGFITDEEHRNASAQNVACRPTTYPFKAPHFADYVASQRTEQSGVVRSTLDSDLQAIAETALAQDSEARRRAGIRGGAVVVLEVKTGAIRALVGSPDYFDATAHGQVNAALASRSAGSTLKPFAFAQGFDRGLITPRSMLADAPLNFADFTPSNFDGDFHESVSARDALILSLNLPSIDLERRIGQPNFHQLLLDVGLRTLNRPSAQYGLGLALGNGEVRTLDLANAYAALARGGEWKPLRWREDAPAAKGRHVISPEAAWLVSEILSGPERALDATGHAADVRMPRIAWKTGTSSGFRDAWTVAWNPRYVVAVWIGNPDGAASPQLVGKRVATPIAWNVFRQLLPANEAPWYPQPEGLATRDICMESGDVAAPACERVGSDYYLSGVTPYVTCAQKHTHAMVEPPNPKISSPANASVFRIAGANETRQQLVLTANADNHWFVDQAYAGKGRTIPWRFTRGRHEIVLSDNRGRSDRVSVTIE